MKKSFWVLIAVVLFLGMANAALSDINTGLVAYYPFSGDAKDKSGNGNDGIVKGAVLTYDRFGNPNSAYSFNGTSDYIDLPTLYSYSPTNFTLNAWIKLDRIGPRQMILGKLSGWTSYTGNIGFEVWGDHLAVDSLDAGSTLDGNTILDINKWYQVTTTYDGSSFKVYLNGVLDGSLSYNGGIGNNTVPWMIGTHAMYGTPGGYYSNFCFDGIIDNVRIYDRALSDVDIQKLYLNSENAPPTLSPIGNKTINEGQPLQFTISANDPEGDALTYSASNLPAGATFDPSTQTFSWIPTFDQFGTYPNIEFSVMDNGSPLGLAVELITIAVGNVNRAPEFNPIGTQEILENHSLQFYVEATDPDGDNIIYSAANLPSGASFDPQTRLFSWIPAFNQIGNYSVDFSATDSYNPPAIGTLSVAIAVNVPPPCELANQIINTVASLNLSKNVENSYMANLKKVCTFVESGKKTPPINQLDAFIKKVQQDISHKNIGSVDGNNLINMANQLIAKIQN
jgi:hypothetical protein